MSERTVEHHVTSILNKLNLHSRVELIVEMSPGAQQGTLGRGNDSQAIPRGILSRSLRVASTSSSRMMSRIGVRIRNAAWFTKANRAAKDRVRHYLPRPATETVGRVADVARAVTHVAASRVVTISGPGGVGKSRVAIEAGFTVRASQDTTCVFIDLAECQTYEDVISAIAAACFRKPGAPDDLLSAIIAALDEQEVLLILDNCERVVESVSALARSLIAETPSVKLLLTSRRPIGLVGERVVRIDALAVMTSDLSRDDILASPAVQLLAARARDCSGLTLDESSLDATVQLCAALDGLPLALELAAAKTPVLSVPQLLAHVDERFALLTVETPATPRHKSLHALIDWSYELLKPREQRLFRALSVFHSAWTMDHVQALLDDIPAITILEGLITLSDHSMISRSDRNGDSCFRMLESFRLFAAMRASECGEAPDLEARHARQVTEARGQSAK